MLSRYNVSKQLCVLFVLLVQILLLLPLYVCAYDPIILLKIFFLKFGRGVPGQTHSMKGQKLIISFNPRPVDTRSSTLYHTFSTEFEG